MSSLIQCGDDFGKSSKGKVRLIISLVNSIGRVKKFFTKREKGNGNRPWKGGVSEEELV